MISSSADALVSPSQINDLADFLRRITAKGYVEFLASSDPSRFSPLAWGRLRHYTFPDLRVLVDFLLLNKAVNAEELDREIGSSWRCLSAFGMLDLDGRKARLSNHCLFFYHGYLFFIDPPAVDPNVYFGDDSIGLFSRIQALPGDRVLDVCSGSGIQAMKSAAKAGHVDAVELNEIPRQVLRVNLALNGLCDKVSVYGGSLFDQIPAGKCYDLVTANPPLVPFPDAVDYPFVGHGGMDGIVVTRRIIAQLPSRLSDFGRAQVIGMTFSSRGTTMIEDELSQLARELDLEIRLTVINHFPVHEKSSFFESLSTTAAPIARRRGVDIRAVFREELEKRDLTHVTSYFLGVQRGVGRLIHQNFSRLSHVGLWYVTF